MEVDEMNIEDLFEDEAHDRDEDDPEEGQEQETSGAQLELGGKGDGSKEGGDGSEKPKKRIIRNPQPKLDPDRILGPRGVPVLEKAFADFKPKGKGEEFRDLDLVMKRMEHWAHRLYPKLPFEDVMNRISILGKKKTVQVNLKKIRMGMQTFVDRADSDDDDGGKVQQQAQNDDMSGDTTKRYDDDVPEDDDALFDMMMREAQEQKDDRNVSQQNVRPSGSQSQNSSTLSDEQRDRMLRNRQIAEEKRKARIRETERIQAESISTQDMRTDYSTNLEVTESGDGSIQD